MMGKKRSNLFSMATVINYTFSDIFTYEIIVCKGKEFMAVKKIRIPPLKRPSNRITVIGGNRLIMEGVQTVRLCSETRMVLQGKMYLDLRGEHLELCQLGNDTMAVQGELAHLHFRETP